MNIARWHLGQLGVFAACMLLGAAAIIAGYMTWEKRYQNENETWAEMSRIAIRGCEIVSCDPQKDTLMKMTMDAMLKRAMVDAPRHFRTRAWLRPVAFTTAFGLIPLLTLAAMWRWFGSRSQRR